MKSTPLERNRAALRRGNPRRRPPPFHRERYALTVVPWPSSWRNLKGDTTPGTHFQFAQFKGDTAGRTATG